MSDVKRCDNCGTVDAGFRWFHVTQDPALAFAVSEWDFCSVECIEVWANKRAAA